MEFPILLIGLSRVGIVTSERLHAPGVSSSWSSRSPRRSLTPGPDIVSPIVLGMTLFLLYEGTVWFIRRTGR